MIPPRNASFPTAGKAPITLWTVPITGGAPSSPHPPLRPAHPPAGGLSPARPAGGEGGGPDAAGALALADAAGALALALDAVQMALALLRAQERELLAALERLEAARRTEGSRGG